ncbi:MAG: hypothetical protein U0X73_09035 [Thermoanaerobaculia bacterium]
MIRALELATAAGRTRLADWGAPLPLERILPGGAAWEVELGFGKGRFLDRRAAESPERRFLGVEVAHEYFELAARRLARRGHANLLLLHGEALYVLAAVLPRGFASAVHVYFPDPWPKSRHQKRRLFGGETVDLVLGLLAPRGVLAFATDFLHYGEEVDRLLAAAPGIAVEPRAGAWPDGARTNYEAKYVAAGRPILRLTARREGPPELQPGSEREVLAAVSGAASTLVAGMIGA